MSEARTRYKSGRRPSRAVREHVLARRLQLAKAKKPQAGDTWSRIGVFGNIATPIVVVLIGWYLSGSVDSALKRSELLLNNSKEIKPLVAQTLKAQTMEDAQAGAAAISAFNEYAIPPLLLLLRSGSANVQRAAEDGLLNVGAVRPEILCQQLAVILGNRTQLYSWENQEAAARLIGQLRCNGGQKVIDDFSGLIGQGLATYQRFVKSDPPPDNASVDKLKCQIRIASSELRGNGADRCVN